MFTQKHLRALLLWACAAGILTWPCRAEAAPDSQGMRAPLLQAGKQTLYQRVISHPGAKLSSAPGAGGMRDVRAFTPFYVYARQQIGGEEWLEVSPASSGSAWTGWLKAGTCSPWDKALTLMFADRLGRDPVLFFHRFSELNTLVRSADMRSALDRLLQNAAAPDGPLLAVEPKDVAVPKKHFYLMPIFDFSDEYEQHNLRLLNIGVVDPGAAPAASEPAVPQRFSAGVAFIVDTTISMGPYINQTKQFIHEAYDALAQSEIANDVSFAVVAYRNSTKHNPKIGYVASVIAPFTPVASRAAAEARIGRMDEARVSTHSFNEDAFAGIKTAVDSLNWSPHAVKVAVMITDAGAIRNDDPLSATGFTEKEMADLLAQKGIRLVVIHLHTAQGKQHHLDAVINQYKQLTAVRDGRVKSTYIALPVRDARTSSRQFGRIATALVGVLQKIVARTAEGAAIAKPQQTAAATPEAAAAYLGECLGYAAYLEFAGQRRQATAPRLLEAWVADKDLDNLVQGKSTDALVAAVLLNKQQLDTLARQIGLLVDAARASRTADSRALFQRIVSLSSQVIRDPERLQRASGENLCEMGLLPEFLTGLPYKSQVMNLTEERWFSMSAREQDELIYSLEAKIRLYAEYHNDADNWMTFGATDPADALYRVPLTSLP